MSRQTGGDALAGQLAREGVEAIFAAPPPFARGRPAPANPLGEPQRAN
jgi:hypothetical protein